jgi:hypothetical protein
MLTSLPLTSPAAGAGLPARADCGLRGTFIQPTNAEAAWSASAWSQLFDEFAVLGITDLFMQWTVLDGTAFFPSARFASSRPAVLAQVSALAPRAGIRMWVGLQLDTRYWKEIAEDADRVGIYLDGRLRVLAELLAELEPALADTPFAGWYITDEVDDQTWGIPAKRAVLKRYLSETAAQLRSRRPASRVAISGFTNSDSVPGRVAEFWGEILKASPIDLLLFQDGVGEGKLRLADVARYYVPLLAAAHEAGAELGGVVELFSLRSDGKRVPGPVDRIREQLALAIRLGGFPPVAFSVPDYMSGLAGAQAAELLAQFAARPRICA